VISSFRAFDPRSVVTAFLNTRGVVIVVAIAVYPFYGLTSHIIAILGPSPYNRPFNWLSSGKYDPSTSPSSCITFHCEDMTSSFSSNKTFFSLAERAILLVVLSTKIKFSLLEEKLNKHPPVNCNRCPDA